MKSTHLVPTPEEFEASVRAEFGPGVKLHPLNRLTSCGRHSGDLDVTTVTERTTCKTCLKAASA